MGGKRLYHSIAQRISDLIDNGDFPVGARLPCERELAERFGVSRMAIREAEIALQAVERIEFKTGSGVFVPQKQSTNKDSLPDLSAIELTEARLFFESEAAALAARNISDQDLQKLEQLIDQMASFDDSISTEADRQFHVLIAEATGNGAIAHTIETFWRMREELPEVKAIYGAVCETDATYRAKEHQDIYEALLARDPAAARKAMREHFHRLIEAMLDTTERLALAEVQLRSSANRQRFLSSQSVN